MTDETRPPAGEVELTRSLERELHLLASRHMRRERQNHTLQTTAIVNEVWLRLGAAGGGQWSDRSHFLAVASRVMRQILVDYARARLTDKRGGGAVVVDAAQLADDPIQPHVLDVHAALEAMSEMAPRQAQLVELRFFGGLSMDEAAEVLGISPRTVDKDWKLARAWLRLRLATAAGT